MHIAIDLDDTLTCTRPKGALLKEIQPPRPGAAEWIKRQINAGHKISIFTARVDHAPVHEWLITHGLDMYIKEVTNIKQVYFDCYIDDRAIGFTNQWPDLIRWQAARRDWIRQSLAPS